MIRILLLASLLAIPSTTYAQTPHPSPTPASDAGRFHIGIDGGSQLKLQSFSDAFDEPLYTELKHVTTDYPDKGGLFVSFGARYRLWKQMTAGVSVSTFSHAADATVKAQLPHPFFDNRFRSIEGTATTTRQEIAVNPTVGVLLPLSSHVQLGVNVGPSILNVKQDFVTDVEFSEAYPFDTAAFTSADTKASSHTAAGIYAGADVTWMFSQHVGAGGLVQVTHATVKQSVGTRTVSIDAGGVQAGGGVRFVF